MWLPEASSGACTGVLACGRAPAIQTRCGPPPRPSRQISLVQCTPLAAVRFSSPTLSSGAGLAL